MKKHDLNWNVASKYAHDVCNDRVALLILYCTTVLFLPIGYSPS